MIICVCRRLNEQAVHEAIGAGARTPDCVQAHHGCAFNCGKCRIKISDMLDDADATEQAEAVLIAAE